jgi:hypothetical protein
MKLEPFCLTRKCILLQNPPRAALMHSCRRCRFQPEPGRGARGQQTPAPGGAPATREEAVAAAVAALTACGTGGEPTLETLDLRWGVGRELWSRRF